MRDRGLVTRLVAATLVAGILTAVIGTVLLRTSARGALRAQVEDRLVRAAERMATGIDDRVRTTVESVELVATRAAVVELSPEAATTELTVVRRVLRNIDRMVLRDVEGRPVAAVSATALLAPSDVGTDPALTELVADGGTAVRAIDAERALLEMVVPVEDPPGTVVGSLTATTPLELVASRVDATVFDVDGGTAFLVDGEGRITVHPERGRSLREERFDLSALDGGRVATLQDGGDRMLTSYAATTTFDAAVVVQQPEISEERLRSILENTTSVVYVKDLEGRYLQVNRRFEELFDVDRGDVIGRSDGEIFPEDQAEVFQDNDLQAIRPGEPSRSRRW